MQPGIDAWFDNHLDRMGANVLLAGVLLSVSIATCGGVVFLTFHGSERLAYHAFRGEPHSLRSAAGILSEAMRLRGRGVIQLGVLVLIVTPMRRVMLSGVQFLRQRNWFYLGLTLAILGLLTYSVVTG